MNSKVALALVLVLGFGWAWAQAAPAPADVKAQIAEKYPDGLPKYLTSKERMLPRSTPTREDYESRVPPTGTVHCAAEYEPCEGLFVSWQGYDSVITELAVGVTTGDPEAMMFVVVDNASQQSDATSTFTSAGVDLSQVEFITRSTDTVWIRDYGPRFIFEDGVRAIVDHTYNRPRPNDNAFNAYVGGLWGEAVYEIPLEHGGGNFHLFADGDAFMTDLILDENPGTTEQEVKNLYGEYQNLSLTIYPGFPTSFDSTQHIDMWMLPVADRKIIIGEYASSTGSPYTITENAVTDLESRGYTVYRTPGWNSGGTHYTYTNAVVLNDQVFVPRFGGSYAAQDAQALAVFQSAFAGKTCRQVYCGGIITAAGAIHCIVMHVPAYTWSMRVTPGDGLDSSGPVGGPFEPLSKVYTIVNDDPDNSIDYEVTEEADWLTITNGTGTIPAEGSAEVTITINAAAEALPAGGYYEPVQFVNLTDHSGDTVRYVDLLAGGPERVYTYLLDSDPGWTTEGSWDFGVPQGLAGSHGGNDPLSGHTGANVYGYNLAGGYEANMPERDLTTSAIDCTGMVDCELRFWRWLGVEEPQFDHAYVRVSNGASQQTAWQNSDTIDDGQWVQQTFDISAIADNQSEVYITWIMGSSDGYWQYCGWNVDDVEIWAIVTGSPELHIVSSDPPYGWYDARRPFNPNTLEAEGCTQVLITFDGPTQGMETADFHLQESCTEGFCDEVPPAVQSVETDGNTATVTLDRPIDPCTWTLIEYLGSTEDNVIRLGYLPADADMSYISNANDIVEVVDCLNVVLGGGSATLNLVDTDRSGALTANDIVEMVDLLNGAGAYDVYFNAEVPQP